MIIQSGRFKRRVTHYPGLLVSNRRVTHYPGLLVSNRRVTHYPGLLVSNLKIIFAGDFVFRIISFVKTYDVHCTVLPPPNSPKFIDKF